MLAENVGVRGVVCRHRNGIDIKRRHKIAVGALQEAAADRHIDQPLGLIRREPLPIKRERDDEGPLPQPVGALLAKGDGDGDLEETFDADDVSGVNTNDDDSDLTVSLDTGYELQAGDRLHLRYEGVDNPDSAGEYDVSVRINDAEWTEGTLAIEG